jgi:hypothetical protein
MYASNLNFSEAALDELAAMKDKVHEIRNFYGEDSVEYRNASESFGRVVYTMIRLGGTIHKDSHLSLIGSNDHITYGVVWFGDKNKATSLPESGEWSVHS